MTQATEQSSLAGNAVEFDQEAHRYTVAGRNLPSVTQVINAVLPGWQADEWYMQKGTAMHYGCQLLDDGLLDWATVAPEIEGRMRAWEKFRTEFPMKVIACEHRAAHPLYRYAGTIDRVFADEAGNIVVADIKSTISPQVRMQLAAYRMLYTKRISRGVAVELRDNGTYSTLWMNKAELELAERTFLAALTIFNFKAKENLK